MVQNGGMMLDVTETRIRRAGMTESLSHIASSHQSAPSIWAICMYTQVFSCSMRVAGPDRMHEKSLLGFFAGSPRKYFLDIPWALQRCEMQASCVWIELCMRGLNLQSACLPQIPIHCRDHHRGGNHWILSISATHMLLQVQSGAFKS